MFGLSRRDLLVAALIARYHRRASPQPSHEGYNTLDRDQRVTVQKLAAILRVAVALDESRTQRIKKVICQPDGDRLIISVPQAEDLSLEQLTLKQHGSLFEETFGMSVLLRATGG
jgi:exopolyphosphatase/guanosine-5'-triphosphate,3'-diphosphate pyrophosphatase